MKISSPNDATTILKTRFIREDYPDIIGIGGDINYSYFVDSGILADLSDYEGAGEVKPATYLDIIERIGFVPAERNMWNSVCGKCGRSARIAKICFQSMDGVFLQTRH
ncbi:MAG: hypothetical protein ACLTS1_10535 [Coprococcus sp.]